jgi:hypothetical protein
MPPSRFGRVFARQGWAGRGVAFGRAYDLVIFFPAREKPNMVLKEAAPLQLDPRSPGS